MWASTFPRFFRTESFLLPAVFGIALSLITALLGIAAISLTERNFNAFIRLRSEDTMTRVRTIYYRKEGRLKGMTGVKAYLIGHQSDTGSTTYNLLQAKDQRISGNMPIMPSMPVGFRELRLSRNLHVLGIGARLDANVYAFVGSDMLYIDNARQQMLYMLLWVLSGILIMAPLGGYLLSRRFLKRVDAIYNTCHAIMTGNLSDRIPMRSSHHELDRLSAVINSMLTRISGLVISLRQVSSDVAHDLRTPMMRLHLGIEKALVGAKPAEELRAEMHAALGASNEILQMFAAILRLSEVEGRRTDALLHLDLRAVVARVLDIYRPVIEDSGRKLIVGELQNCAILGDKDLLPQLLSNLLDNSIIHTPKDTGIIASLQCKNGEAFISIQDNGAGIPEHEREKVFQRFYRRDVSRTSPGHGLGLSLVAAIAEAHGGSVTISDPAEASTTGVQFVVRLPLDVSDPPAARGTP